MTPSNEDPLQASVRFLSGVGLARADLLQKLGIETVFDLLWHLPREVLDLTQVLSPRQLVEKKLQSVRGEVVDVDAKYTSTGKHMTACLIDCGQGQYVRGVWFNQPYMLKKLQMGQHLLFSGKPKWQQGRWEFGHPTLQWLDADDEDAAAGVLTRYSLTDGLRMHEMRRMMRHAVENHAQQLPEHLPDEYRNRRSLPRLGDAMRLVHLPGAMAEYHHGMQRLLFDDLIEFQLGIALRRRAWRRMGESPSIETTAKIDSRIRRLFPFAFTAGQDQAIRELTGDLQQTLPMHRLLQADVGAGKTVVAVYAMLAAIANGFQAAMMVPTEVLASQHWETINSLLANSRVERAVLTGKLSNRQRSNTLADLKSGRIQLVVGTQSLIQEAVEFQRLGVAVIDEQHKFGVSQRSQFSAGANPPHVLVMTATPIPRSLCLTQFGDLDLTTVSDLPPGRQRVVTSIISGIPSRKKAWDFIRKQLRTGRQLFVVCPRIGESASTSDDELGDFTRWEEYAPESSQMPSSDRGLDSAAAEVVFPQLKETELADCTIGMVHGRMDDDERRDVMESFRTGDVQALVATTIIEVGIDVPNATLMVVLDAHRFGLSQLHQLRGRIARGKHQGYCFLFSEADSPEARSRLGILEQTSDGFQVAERDFELRGPGDALGTRQHGGSPLRVADLNRDKELVLQTREEAFHLVSTGEFDQPEFAPLKLKVLERFGKLMNLPLGG